MRLLALGALLACSPARSQGLERGPYLVAASSVSAQICWRFKSKDDCHLFEGLQPATTFSYSFGGISSQVWTGQTLPSSSQTITFATFGELGPDAAETARLAGGIGASGSQMVIVLGNVAYPSGQDKVYDAQYFKPFAELLTRIPFFTIAGDADYGDYSTANKAAEHFKQVYESVQHKPAYYSFDAGPAHFAALDTNSALYMPAAAPLEAGSEQRRWLDDDLARSSARWKIVLSHVPLYSTMRYNGDHRYLRHVLEPLLVKHHVDLVLQANDRVYERSNPVSGMVFVTAGTGGAKLDLKQEIKDADWLAKRVPSFGFVKVTASPQALRVVFLDDAGAARDEFTLTKSTQ